MSPDKLYRGLLLNHDLGSGKTRTAISVAEQYRAMGVNPPHPSQRRDPKGANLPSLS